MLGDRKFEFVRLIWIDYAGIRRCSVVPRTRLDAIAKTGVGLGCACLFLPSWGDSPPSSDPAGQATGECRLIPDLTTLKQLPWLPSESMALVHMHREDTGEPWDCCPRTALAKALEGMEEEYGITLVADFECEFTLFDTSEPVPLDELPLPIESSVYCQTSAFEAASPVLQQICLSLEDLGQSVEQVHAESAPGQFEIVTAFGPALEAADKFVYRKESISAVAHRHGMTASFLPKIDINQAGNGCHIHFSFVDVVTRETAFESSTRPHNLSALAESFAAGVLRHLPALMIFTAANPNSYHRIKPSTWSGAYQCWGVNNREVPLRLVGLPGQPSTLNFELKTVDGTANPYLALVAIIAAGIAGLSKGYALPEPVFGDPAVFDEETREEKGIKLLPASLKEALEAYEGDEVFRKVLLEVTGSETLCRVYPVIKQSECEKLSGLSLDEQAKMLYARF